MNRTNFSIPGRTNELPSPFERASSSSNPGRSQTGPSGRSIVVGQPTDWDAWYLAQIEQYSGNKELYNQLLNNPYYIKNAGPYSPYWYEDALGIAGTNADRYYNQLKSDASQWISEYVNKYNDREYESAPNQTALAQQAGYNVDLTGASGLVQSPSGNPAKPNIDDSLPNPSGSTEGLNMVHTAISGVVSLMTSGLSIAQSFQGLQAGEINLLSGELQNEKSFAEFLTNTVSQNLSASELKDFLYGNPDSDVFRKASERLSFIFSDDFQNQLPRHLRSRFSRLKRNQQFNNSYDFFQLQDILKSYASNKYDTASVMGHPFYKDDFSETMREIGDYVSKYVVDYEKMIKDFDFDKYDIVDKEGHSQGFLAGQANVAGLSYEALSKQNDALVEKMWNDIESKLSEKNSWWSNILLFMVPVVRAWSLSLKAPSVHLGASYQGRSGVSDTRDVYLHNPE